MERLIGRNQEQEELRMAMQSSRSEFIVLYGRRRVGKTFLVRKFFDDRYTFRYVGAHKQTKATQLKNFREALVAYSGGDIIPEINDWHEAFYLLQQYLAGCKDKRKVIFFDEMPWADSHGSNFVAELEYFWANYVQTRDDIVFIACGSATNWMKEKIEDNKGGLHNRITRRIYLRPFYLSECKEYFEYRGFDWDEYEILQCYMIFGGVPYYLSLLNPYKTLIENVDYLIFKRGGNLCDEFNELYNALFSNAERYINVVKLLSSKKSGMTRSEIEASTGYSGGNLSKMLDNLERCDFISSYSQFGMKTKQTMFRLSDFYSLFYFRYVENNNTKDELYWQHHFMDRSVEAWRGLTFEEVCMWHLPHIKQALGISGMATEASSWRYVPGNNEERAGCQIDIVIKRVDNLIHLIECKFSDTQYTITKDYSAKLKERMMIFKEVTGVRQSIATTFISPFGIKNNANSSFIHSQLTTKNLFRSIE